MKNLLLVALSLFISGISLAQQKYSRVKVNTDSHGLQFLAELGVAVDHGTYKQNTFFISDFSESEIQVMLDHGFDIEIQIDDVQKYYVEQNLLPQEPLTKNPTGCTSLTSNANDWYQNPAVPSQFNQGSMGGYLTYNQMLAELDQMVASYPNLITAKAPISNFLTFEGRPIYHVIMSDNPSVNESNETKVLYSAIHHAREPMSMIETIFYMWYMLENYSTNPEIQYILNNMQLYFVPCLNPDGYVYNETTNPNGGGMHRKNRRNVGTTNKGVDLNRNYSYGWGTTGVSFAVNDDTYPGTGAFSEPETQAMKWLVTNNKFVTAFNAHTYGNDILFPIGTTTAEFADHHNYFQAESNHMVQFNGYGAMKSSSLYPASGDSDDYMYKVDNGVGVKDTMFVHTPEIGTAFWPAASAINATCQDMFYPNLVLAHLSRKYVIVTDQDPSNIATMTGNFNHSAYRLGRENGSVTVSIQPLLNIASVGAPVVYNLNIMQTQNGAISYTLNPSIQVGDLVKYVLQTDNGMWVKRDTITKTYGALTLQALEDATITANWTGNWSTTTSTFVSPSKSFTDSPTGNYGNNTNRTYTYVPTIDLTNASDAMISYYAKWNIEADFDFVQFQVSVDGGTTWIGQCTNYTVPGTSGNGSVQPSNQPVYEGVQADWVLDEVSLSDYFGQVIKVRFQLRSDAGATFDGFYFDDFKVMFNENGPATAPTASFTATQTSVCQSQTVNFNDFSSNVPTSWTWNFGDGGSSTVQSPSHTYTTPGVYTVSLTVSNAAGTDTYTLTNYITVLASPAVTLTSSDADNTVCITGGTVALNASPSSAALSGSGVSGTTFNPATAGIGTALITATYTDAQGCVGTSQLNISVQDCASIENLFYNGVSIHPNPNNGSFSIEGLDVGASIAIYDMSGRLIYTNTIEDEKMEVKIEQVRSGLYYLQTVKNGKLGQMKFTVL